MKSRIQLLALSLAALGLSACSLWRSPHPGLATVNGRVVFDGLVPSPKTIPVPAPFSRAFPAGLSIPPCQVGAEGGLGEVLVYIANPPLVRAAPETRPASLWISNTVCYPRLIAVQTNQTVQVQVTGDFLLNLMAVSPTGQGWNRAVSGETSFETRFSRPDLAVRLSDNNAVWLAARIAVFDHPWFAVTGPDGSFSLPPLPPGEYTLKTVHRHCGPRSQVVRVSPTGASTTVHLSAPGEAAGN